MMLVALLTMSFILSIGHGSIADVRIIACSTTQYQPLIVGIIVLTRVNQSQKLLFLYWFDHLLL